MTGCSVLARIRIAERVVDWCKQKNATYILNSEQTQELNANRRCGIVHSLRTMSPIMQVLYTCTKKSNLYWGRYFTLSQSNHIIQKCVYTYLPNCKLVVLVLYDVGFLTDKHLYLIHAITEHAVRSQSSCHLYCNNIASKSTQFCKGLMCERQHVSTVLELEYIIDQKKNVVFLDLSKTFNHISATFASQGSVQYPRPIVYVKLSRTISL